MDIEKEKCNIAEMQYLEYLEWLKSSFKKLKKEQLLWPLLAKIIICNIVHGKIDWKYNH